MAINSGIVHLMLFKNSMRNHNVHLKQTRNYRLYFSDMLSGFVEGRGLTSSALDYSSLYEECFIFDFASLPLEIARPI